MSKYSAMEKRLSDMMDRLMMDAFYGTSAATNSPEQEPFTLAKLEKLIAGLPPVPPTIKFVRDDVFPQEHYADEVAIIPHHPAHTLFAKILLPDAPTATVMKAKELTRANGAYQIGNVVYAPSSYAEKIKAAKDTKNG